MYKTLLILTAIAVSQARPNEDEAVAGRLNEVPVASATADDCETLDNGCPVDFTIHKLIPHEEYCHLFYYCDKGELVLWSCPEPLYFDPKSQVCVWSWQTECVNNGPYTYPTTAVPGVEISTVPESTEIEEVLENGCPADSHIHHLLPHEECEKFYQCNFGQKVERDCAPGTVFHFEIQVCDWPRNVPRCAGSAGATARPSTTPEASSEEIPTPNDPVEWESLPNGCPVDSSIHHLLPHESDCGKFYVCDNGRLVELGCGAGTHFSPSQQTCTWPHEAGCEHWTGGGGCSTPGGNGGSCGGSSAVPSPTTSVVDVITTPGSNDITTPVVDDITTPESNNITTPVVNDITTPEPNNITTTVVNDITTPKPNNITTPVVNDITTPEPNNITTTVVNDITTPESNNITTPVVNDITTPKPNNITTPVVNDITTPESDDITTPVVDNTSTPVAEFETTTTPEPDCDTQGSVTDPITEDPITDEATEDPIIDEATEDSIDEETTPDCDNNSSEEVPAPADPVVPDSTTTPRPCPNCPTVPLTPEEKCKQGCNVEPWAHPECDKYYSCIGNEYRLNICSEGLHFNPRTLTCDFICNAGCVRNIPQVTRHEDGVLMFVPNSFNNKLNMMELIEHELNGDL